MCEMRPEFSNFEESLQLLFYSVCGVCFTTSISKAKTTQILYKLGNLSERKNTLRKLNLTFECRTDALLDKKQKKK